METASCATVSPLAVLISGGLDSAILLGETVRQSARVHPLYIRTGLHWEREELHHLHRFLQAVRCPTLGSLQVLDLPVADLYEAHWSITGKEVPGAETPDGAVYLPGRNVLLLSKAVVWCHLHHVPAVALALLAANPFPDASPAFFAAFQDALGLALENRIEVLRPYAGLSKREVLQRGRELPLTLTFSCIRPVTGQHCGRCNKCAERRRAFADAGMTDGTVYQPEGACIG
jgi:7-cyano-7-deazaguanine synthase